MRRQPDCAQIDIGRFRSVGQELNEKSIIFNSTRYFLSREILRARSRCLPLERMEGRVVPDRPMRARSRQRQPLGVSCVQPRKVGGQVHCPAVALARTGLPSRSPLLLSLMQTRAGCVYVRPPQRLPLVRPRSRRGLVGVVLQGSPPPPEALLIELPSRRQQARRLR